MEGARLRSAVALYRDVAQDTVVEDNGSKQLKAGQRILCNLVNAHRTIRTSDILLIRINDRLLPQMTQLRFRNPRKSNLTVT
jgi:hypothetical protein